MAQNIINSTDTEGGLFSYVERLTGKMDPNATSQGKKIFARILGNANEFKEGDRSIGVAAVSEEDRAFARELLSKTKLSQIEQYPYLNDKLYRLCREVDRSSAALTKDWDLGQLKAHLLRPAPMNADQQEQHGNDDGTTARLPREGTIDKSIIAGLSSDVIGCVVKLMTNEELVFLGANLFNPIPGSNLGSKGYFGARVQPNSPTDDPEDIFWQVLNAFSFAVGDVMLGTNPVGSDPSSVLRIELALKDIIETFSLKEVLPHCVLAHIDIQAKVEKEFPGATALWFQSIAGSDAANQTFDLPVRNMVRHAESRNTRFGLYLETGQGADYTNGHSKGIDMVMHDARKYGFARALKHRVEKAQRRINDCDDDDGDHIVGRGIIGSVSDDDSDDEDATATAPTQSADVGAAVFINDVSGFIGPECFRTKEQLVRVCLEDIAMGKLHGLTVGLDVCATLHMDVSLDDLDWCLDHILPANPAWAMALPTKNDPMLSYLTTAFQDHVRLREKFNYKVDDKMWAFFKNVLKVVDADGSGKPTQHFGNPAWVFLQYVRCNGQKFGAGALSTKSDAEILQFAHQRIDAIKARGVPLAIGYGANPWDMNPSLDAQIRALCDDAKEALWHEFPSDIGAILPSGQPFVGLETCATSREDYVFHPTQGETLSERSAAAVVEFRRSQKFAADEKKKENATQQEAQQSSPPSSTPPIAAAILISDGLCADAITDDGHLEPYLKTLQTALRRDLPRNSQVVANTDNNSSTTVLIDEVIVVRGGRVRAGYHIGKLLFGDEGITLKEGENSNGRGGDESSSHHHHHYDTIAAGMRSVASSSCGGGGADESASSAAAASLFAQQQRPIESIGAVIHVIGERPGNGHHTFSAYIVATDSGAWARGVDHDINRVVSGIADTSYNPRMAAEETSAIVVGMVEKLVLRHRINCNKQQWGGNHHHHHQHHATTASNHYSTVAAVAAAATATATCAVPIVAAAAGLLPSVTAVGNESSIVTSSSSAPHHQNNATPTDVNTIAAPAAADGVGVGVDVVAKKKPLPAAGGSDDGVDCSISSQDNSSDNGQLTSAAGDAFDEVATVRSDGAASLIITTASSN